MSELSTLTPKSLWEIFSQICAIPHPSHHEAALSAHIVDLAKKNNIHVETDHVGNILLRKPATPGFENLHSVVLQAHLDMVPQKNDDVDHDFLTDPIKLRIEDGWVKATGTTLGADNGIGMASALAVLFDPSVEHGPIEVLLTMTEETGMEGAFGLQPNWLQSQFLINTDSETEGEVYIGCAGGVNFESSLALSWQAAPAGTKAYQIAFTGLKGGHSGVDIHRGRGNANLLLARFLHQHATSLNLPIAHIQGGTLRNAIPREAYATVLLTDAQVAQVEQACTAFKTVLRAEFGEIEPNVNVIVKPAAAAPTQVLTSAVQKTLIAWLNSAPNGVVSMSTEIEGVVETSLNLGVVSMTEKEITLLFLIRSLADSAKESVLGKLTAHSELVNARAEIDGDYPGWTPDTSSTMLQTVRQSFERLYGKLPKTMVIHAGLECGLFNNSYPNMDMVSIGPTIMAAHSPDERVEIKSVELYWELLLDVLKAIPKK